MPDISGIDLTPLLNLIRGAQAASSLPEPQPDLANGAYSNEQAQRWMVWRNNKIQAAQVPQNVKDQMIAGEDFGEGEPMPHADQYLFGTRDNPLIQEGPGGAPVGARDVPGSADRNRFWNADPNGEGPNIAPYNAPGVQEDREQPIAVPTQPHPLLQLLQAGGLPPRQVVSSEGGLGPNSWKNLLQQIQQDMERNSGLKVTPPTVPPGQLAPGFTRGPDGLLLKDGRPPDTFLGGILPGGGAVPAWTVEPKNDKPKKDDIQ